MSRIKSGIQNLNAGFIISYMIKAWPAANIVLLKYRTVIFVHGCFSGMGMKDENIMLYQKPELTGG